LRYSHNHSDRRGWGLRAAALLLGLASCALADEVTFNARTAKSGNWSDASTWVDGRSPRTGDFVQVRPGHAVVYDVDSAMALRMVHVGGTLKFSHKRNTRLDVGLLKVQAGESCTEDGFVCAVHPDTVAAERKEPSKPATSVDVLGAVLEGQRPALEIGTAEDPMPDGVTATIRLVYFEGTDRDSLPALVDCGGRMDLHGAPMNRTWSKLERPAAAGDTVVRLAEIVVGWKVGDRVILTAAHPEEYQEPKYDKKSNAGTPAKRKSQSGTEERQITKIEGQTLSLDRPLEYEHVAAETGRCEVANLSRNVVIESADPAGDNGHRRGHTMYHRHSSGSISYAEFRHLGKQGVLGRYPIHFHLVRDSMRGSGGVVGASIWDSGNRFIAIHGTDYLLVRDVVGYQCVGHGFFLEDATEQYNVLDRNLAVQAKQGKPLPQQVLTFDQNEGAGFWWANGRNTLTRNVACENHKYGFRFEIGKIAGKAPLLWLKQPDGTMADQDVRGIPFLRFEDNESHSEGLYSFFFGDDPAGSVHGDKQHPFIARHLMAWETHYALRPGLTHFLMEHLYIEKGAYGVYHPDYNAHVYRDVRVSQSVTEPINRGHDDESIQFGSFTYDNLTLDRCSGMPIIQLSCTAPVEGLTGHFRNVTVIPASYPRPKEQRVIDLGVGPILPDKELQKGVVYYFHDTPPVATGEKVLRVVSEKFPALMSGGDYKIIPGFTGKRVRAAEVSGVAFPDLLDPLDDLPPATIITLVRREQDKESGKAAGKLLVRGVTQDNGEVSIVTVNGQPAKIISQRAGVADWETVVDPALNASGDESVTAKGIDKAGNVEATVATVRLTP
jgi:hypothetical protein